MSLHESSLENLSSNSFLKLRIEDWKSRLIDLSKRNRLLYFKPSKRGSLSISHPDMVTIFNKLVLRKRKLEFFHKNIIPLKDLLLEKH